MSPSSSSTAAATGASPAPTLILEPLPDSGEPFEKTQIRLNAQGQVYIVGFRKHPVPALAHPHLPSAPEYDDESDFSVRDVSRTPDDSDASCESGAWARNRARAREITRAVTQRVGLETTAAPVDNVNELGFAGELVDDKLCIIPADSPEARTMRNVYAAIWLAPGYKVMLFPAEGSKVYYQRAIPGNERWKRIKRGYGVDLADPLLTLLDDAIHIKFDTTPAKKRSGTGSSNSGSGSELLHKIQRFLRRSSPSNTSNTNATTPTLHSLVRHVHTELEGNEVHDEVRNSQIAARVVVNWGRTPPDSDVKGEENGEKGEDEEKSGWRKIPEKGTLEDLKALRVEAAAALEKENGVDKMVLDEGRGREESIRALSSASKPSLPNIPEHEDGSASGDAKDKSNPDSTPQSQPQHRPTSSRSKSNTAKAPPSPSPSSTSSSAASSSSPSKDRRAKARTRSPSPSPSADSSRRAPKSA